VIVIDEHESATYFFCSQEVDIRQIHDKFPDHVGGLKDLYSTGPPQAFFVVKLWVNERQFV